MNSDEKGITFGMRIFKILLCGIISLVLASCSVMPKEITPQERHEEAQLDLKNIYANQESVKKPITLPEAIARTLKYNLDYHVKRMESALEAGQLKLAILEMFPDLNANAQYTHRNKESREYIIDKSGNLRRNESSVTPKQLTTSEIGLQWNLLDFGLSYVHAKQQADKVLVMHEQRRKVMQELINRVIVAYWKAHNAQIMIKEVRFFQTKIRQALQRSEKITTAQLAPIEQQLDYQHVLIRSQRRLSTYEMQLLHAKKELANLMNLPVSQDYKLVQPSLPYRDLPKITVPLEKVDAVALVNRPELKEMSYKVRIMQKGVTATVLEMLPGIKFNFGYHYNNDKYLVHNNWLSTDVLASWQLLKLASAPISISAAKSGVALEKARQMATTVSVLTQIRLACLRYDLWRKDYYSALKEHQVASKLYQHTKNLNTAKAGNEQEVIRRGLVAMNANLDRVVSFAKAKEGLGSLYQSIGIDLLPDQIEYLTVDDLAKEIDKAFISRYQEFNKVVSKQYDQIFLAQEFLS